MLLDLKKHGRILNHLEASGIRNLEDYHFQVLDKKEIQENLGFNLPPNWDGYGLKIPYPGKDFFRIRVFPHVTWNDGKTAKYFQRKESGVHLYFPSLKMKKRLMEELTCPIAITEGEFKATCGYSYGVDTIGMGGIWNWKTKDKPILDEFLDFSWINRVVYIIPDSDFIVNDSVKEATFRLGVELQQRGAKVWVLCLPHKKDGKNGLDDYLVNNGNWEQLIKTKIKINHHLLEVRKPGSVGGKSGLIVEAIKTLKYKFRYNEVSNTIDYQKGEESDIWEPVNNRKLNRVYQEVRQFRDLETQTSHRIFENINSDLVSYEFDPFKMFFETNQWDGRPRIGDLFDILNPSNIETLDYFIKWFVNCIPCMLGLERNEVCLTLYGPKGTLKTTFFNSLFAFPEFSRYYKVSKSINPDNKDDLSQVVTNGLINFDELRAISKAKFGEVKMIFSIEVIKYRKPYDTIDSIFRRRANFCGTSDKISFLDGEEDVRRFVVLKIPKPIEIKELAKIDMRQVWLEAYKEYMNGFRYWLTYEEIEKLKLMNKEFQSRSIAEEVILNLPSPKETTDHPENWHTATEIAKHLLPHGVQFNNSFLQGIGKALANDQYVRASKDGVYKWNVLLKK